MKQREVKSGMEVMYNGRKAKVHLMMLNSVFLELEDKATTRVTYDQIEPIKNKKV